MPAITVCPQCESAHWADKPHSCGVEHDRLEAQASAMKARQVVELVQRCSQLKWLAACILAKGPGLPSMQQWASLYRLAEGAEPLAKQTLEKYPLGVRELEMQEYRYRASLASADRSPQGEDPQGLHAKHESAVGEAETPKGDRHDQ